MGEIGELFVNKERFDVYVCERCGRVELFVDGVAERVWSLPQLLETAANFQRR